MNLSLVEAAARQTNAAIDAIQRGKFDVAITLAGAAEGMLKERTAKIPSKFEIALFLRTAEEGTRDLFSKKELIVFLNTERDWLKHGGETGALIASASAPVQFIPGFLIGLGLLFFGVGEWINHPFQFKRAGGKLVENHPWNPRFSHFFGLARDAIGIGLFIFGLFPCIDHGVTDFHRHIREDDMRNLVAWVRCPWLSPSEV